MQTVSVFGAYLTDISATTTAPFELSTDNEYYSSSASLPATGGTLYVRYAPTAIGNHTGDLTITSGTLSQTVTLNGK